MILFNRSITRLAISKITVNIYIVCIKSGAGFNVFQMQIHGRVSDVQLPYNRGKDYTAAAFCWRLLPERRTLPGMRAIQNESAGESPAGQSPAKWNGPEGLGLSRL